MPPIEPVQYGEKKKGYILIHTEKKIIKSPLFLDDMMENAIKSIFTNVNSFTIQNHPRADSGTICTLKKRKLRFREAVVQVLWEEDVHERRKWLGSKGQSCNRKSPKK